MNLTEAMRKFNRITSKSLKFTLEKMSDDAWLMDYSIDFEEFRITQEMVLAEDWEEVKKELTLEARVEDLEEAIDRLKTMIYNPPGLPFVYGTTPTHNPPIVTCNPQVDQSLLIKMKTNGTQHIIPHTKDCSCLQCNIHY